MASNKSLKPNGCRISLRVTDEMWEYIQKKCEELGTSQSIVTKLMLSDYIKRNP